MQAEANVITSKKQKAVSAEDFAAAEKFKTGLNILNQNIAQVSHTVFGKSPESLASAAEAQVKELQAEANVRMQTVFASHSIMRDDSVSVANDITPILPLLASPMILRLSCLSWRRHSGSLCGRVSLSLPPV